MDFLLINDWLNRGYTNYSFKWDHFLLVFLILAFGIWLGFYLRNKDTKTVKIVLYVLWGVSIAVGATFYTLTALACRKGIGGFFEDTLGVILPLHSCFMFVFLFPVAMFVKNKYVKKAASNFLVVVNMIMGFITLFVGCPIPYFSAFSLFGLQTIIYHGIIVIVPFVMLMTRLYEIEKDDIKYGLIAFGILATSIWIFDAITGCDYSIFMMAIHSQSSNSYLKMSIIWFGHLLLFLSILLLRLPHTFLSSLLKVKLSNNARATLIMLQTITQLIYN